MKEVALRVKGAFEDAPRSGLKRAAGATVYSAGWRHGGEGMAQNSGSTPEVAEATWARIFRGPRRRAWARTGR